MILRKVAASVLKLFAKTGTLEPVKAMRVTTAAGTMYAASVASFTELRTKQNATRLSIDDVSNRELKQRAAAASKGN